MFTEYILELIAIIIALAIYAAPIVIIVLIVKAIKRKAKDNHYAQKKKGTTQYKTGYKWNETTQLWEPPGQKNDTIRIMRNGPSYEEWKTQQYQEKTKSTYHYTKADLPKDESELPKQPANSPKKEETKAEQKTQHFQYANATYSYKSASKPITQPKTAPEPPKPTPKRKSEYQGAYEAVSLLTLNEKQNYKTLREAAKRKGYTVNAKVRLADLIKPRNDEKYMSLFGKIKSKHVDFVVCDRDMRVKAIIELDDRSHDRKDRQDRDDFVDTILEDTGYKGDSNPQLAIY